MLPVPSGINITFEFHEVPTDGTFCCQCGCLMTPAMHQMYVSVNIGGPLGFEMLPSKYKFCTPCKIKSDDSDGQ